MDKSKNRPIRWVWTKNKEYRLNLSRIILFDISSNHESVNVHAKFKEDGIRYCMRTALMSDYNNSEGLTKQACYQWIEDLTSTPEEE
jgi:hypothetical protein